MTHDQQAFERFVPCSEKILLWVATQVIGKKLPALMTLDLDSNASGKELAPTPLRRARFSVIFLGWTLDDVRDLKLLAFWALSPIPLCAAGLHGSKRVPGCLCTLDTVSGRSIHESSRQITYLASLMKCDRTHSVVASLKVPPKPCSTVVQSIFRKYLSASDLNLVQI